MQRVRGLAKFIFDNAHLFIIKATAPDLGWQIGGKQPNLTRPRLNLAAKLDRDMRIAVDGILMWKHLGVHEAAHRVSQHLLFVVRVVEHDQSSIRLGSAFGNGRLQRLRRPSFARASAGLSTRAPMRSIISPARVTSWALVARTPRSR